ncbi:MAG: creatininase family protein [Nitrososphaeria archaeon]
MIWLVEDYGTKTWSEVATVLNDGLNTVIIPIGTVEAHGKHLPITTDAILPQEICKRLSDKVKALVAPPIYYGVTTSLSNYPGSIPVSRQAFTSYLTDIFVGFAKSGFLNIIVVNGHAGNVESIREAAEKAYDRARIRTLDIDWYIACDDVVKKHYGTLSGHGTIEETAAILAVDKKLVKNALYDKKQAIRRVEGTWMYPMVGSMIKRDELDIPNFDLDKGKKFFAEVCQTIEGIIADYMARASENPL